MLISDKIFFLIFIALVVVVLIRSSYKPFYTFCKKLNNVTKVVFLFAMVLIACIITIIVFPGFHFEFSSSQECWEEKNTKQMDCYGLIKRKYIDSNNHDIQAIDVVSNDGVNTLHFGDGEEGDLWERIKINDSIRKEAGGLMFFIKTADKWDTVTVKYYCKR
jgi:hypothetical protein